ncbi:MAG TPA: VanZ family protein [Gammaproteobacteria bacterium]|nr:VanZ family protein [Gammaproteobacteria bacterium]
MNERSPYKLAGLTGLAYMLFIIYGSFVPFAFTAKPLAEAWMNFRHIGDSGLTASRTDFATNVILYIPLAFLLCSACWRVTHTAARVLLPLIVFGVCALVTVGIEFLQQFFPPRTPSIYDIYANLAGAGAGVMLAWLLGTRFVSWVSHWSQLHRTGGMAQKLLYAYVLVIFAYSVLPLDLTISPIELFHKWREGRVNLIPFAFGYDSTASAFYQLATDAALWVPVAMLCRLTRKSRQRSFAFVVGAATVLELAQLFVYSRVTDTTDIVTAMAGGGLGVAAADMLSRFGWLKLDASQTPARQTHLTLWWTLALGAWLITLAALFWFPFDFRTERAFLLERSKHINLIPFASYYFSTEFRAVTEIIHKLVFFAPLGALLAWPAMRLRFSKWHGPYIAGAMAVLAVTPAMIELGQLALPGKVVDVTDWGLSLTGGLAGYWAARALHRHRRRTQAFQRQPERPLRQHHQNQKRPMGNQITRQ